MPKQIREKVWLWPKGVQFVRKNGGYVYLSWTWPFVTVCR